MDQPRRAADLRAAGVSKERLRGKLWHRVGQGIYLTADGTGSEHRGPDHDGPDQCGPGADRPAQRVLNCVPLLTEDSALGGWAAAYVLGADWLDGIDRWTGRPLPVDIVGPLRRRSTSSVNYRFTDRPIDRTLCLGVPVTNTMRTAVDGTRWSSSPMDGLVFCDAMVRAGLITPEQLDRQVAGLRGLHGLTTLRDIAPLVRTNVWSPWESVLRYVYRVDAGLPDPLLNVRVFDNEGLLLGRPDLFDPESALAVEFDGEGHRDRRQHQRDNIREEGFEAAGITVTRVDSLDLRPRDRRGTIRRIRSAHARGLTRDRTKDRWFVDPRVWS